MNLIQQITSDTLQKQKLVLDDGTIVQITICFKPMQFGWFIQELVYGNVTIQGRRIFVSPNMLYQFRNQLPFGIGCFSLGNREPSQQEDFSSGNVQLYILTQAEVNQYAEFLSGQARP